MNRSVHFLYHPFLLFFLLFFNFQIDGFGQIFQTEVLKKRIESVQMHPKSWVLGNPILKLDSTNHLIVGFDDLNDQFSNYRYKIIHCTYDWKQSDIEPLDYLQGFQTNDVMVYRHSTNTVFSYYHFEIEIPNDRVRILLSGNYILQVVEASNEEDIVFQHRFYVLENKVSTTASIHRPSMAQYLFNKQQIDFTVHHSDYNIDDAERDLKLVVLQNFRSDNVLSQLRPKFIRPGEIVYDSDTENLFNGGNEFRWFDCKNIYFKSERVRNIEAIGRYYHIYLEPDDQILKRAYEYRQDLNGKYLIKQDGASDNTIDADYVFVHFRLRSPLQFANTDVYVYGGFTSWTFNSKYKMTYNLSTQSYETVLFFKQGLYNYNYALVDEAGAIKLEDTNLEGSFWNTENDYQIFVYHRSTDVRYDKLIGINFYNSLKRF